ncbi:MAG: M55 family metallopeptidase [Candidatus Acetothermia bacterium]
MKVLISADMEGISGVVNGNQVTPGEEEYKTAREMMIKDTNAAIEGALDAGADEIVVNDSHDGMVNLLPEKLHPEARLISGYGKPLVMMEGVQDVDVAMFVGYHARIGTLKGVLSHSYFGGNINGVEMNGVEAGEPEINAAIAGHYDVPVVFTSGGQRVCDLVQESIGKWITVAPVKEDLSRTAAKCLHPQRARELIKQRAKQAFENLTVAEPVKPDLPISFEVKFFTGQMADQAEMYPFSERVNSRTIRVTGEDVVEGFRAFMVLAKLGQAELF